MTICVSVKVAEGLVFAADSVTTLLGAIKTPQGTQEGAIQMFEFANKVTQVKDYPIAVMSWGAASISDRTIQSLVMEFEYNYPFAQENQGYKVEKVASELVTFIGNRYDAKYPHKDDKGQPNKQRPVLGLAIGGYSDKEFFADQFNIEFPRKEKLDISRPNKPDGSPNFGANWYGQGGALFRLIKGFDQASIKKLVERGADKDIVQKWIDDNVSELQIIFDGMPLQDAIDFANYAARVVIGISRFGMGAPTCGGDIDIAVMRPNNFDWASQKQWAIK